jgi:hypothetical protein
METIVRTDYSTISREGLPLTNGSGGAAILAAGVGAFVLALLALAADKSPGLKAALIFYRPAGALSGVTTLAILVWLTTWALLHWRWRTRDLSLIRINWIAYILLCLSFLLTFPPVVDLL